MKTISRFLFFAILLFFNSAFADIASDAEKLFNWGEQKYPKYFSTEQTKIVTQVTDYRGYKWYYRYYPQTKIYFITNKLNKAYVLGGVFGSNLLYVGTIQDLLNENTDVTPPVITLLGNNPVSVNQGSIYNDAGATATDDVDESVKVTTSGSVDTSKVGTYTITYTATDKAGNQATATRTVNVNTVFYKGKGTSEEPYQITSCQQLQNMQDYLSSHFVLNNDIDCSDTVNWNNGAGFKPVAGNDASYFSGNFDGQNYSISNLYINNLEVENRYVGLFGQVSGDISNVTLSNVKIYGGETATVGALAGYTLYNKLTNISVASGKITSGATTGGIVGYMLIDEGQFLENSYSNVSLEINRSSAEDATFYHSVYVGGLVGSINTNCNGRGQGGDIRKSYSLGDININIKDSVDIRLRVGGIIGTLVDGTCGGDILNSYSLSSISVVLDNTTLAYGDSTIGGLAGYAYRGIIENSYSAGSINYKTIGNNPTLTIGGLVGTEHDSISNNSYWDTEVTNISSSSLGVGKTTSELQTPSSSSGIYSNWDSIVWKFGTSSQYPIIRE